MKRFLFAQEQLAAQGKARIRQWPKNKGGCASPANRTRATGARLANRTRRPSHPAHEPRVRAC